jgi:cyclopropane fatty-acyl-phospholipid synthase-like methyltransferase
MFGTKNGIGRLKMERKKSDFYDEEYFTGKTKSNYGRLNPNGGYTKEAYIPYKAEQGQMIFEKLGYSYRWKPDNILVLGCAVGYLVQTIAEVAKVETHGVDISEYAIKRGTRL